MVGELVGALVVGKRVVGDCVGPDGSPDAHAGFARLRRWTQRFLPFLTRVPDRGSCKTFYILETRTASSALPDVVDPEDDELGSLYLACFKSYPDTLAQSNVDGVQIGAVVFKQVKQYKT
eukprot:9484860-Pyramimonas_sp.AAC.2